MDDALAVDHDLDPLRREAEQPVGLDDLQPLIHEGRAVDRHLGPHIPVRVVEGLLGFHPRHLFWAAAVKGPSAACEDDASDCRAVLALKALKYGRMLAINRYEITPSGSLADHQRSCADHNLLVGQGNCLARSDRLQGREKPLGPHDGRHDRLSPLHGRHFQNPFRPASDRHIRAPHLLPEPIGGLLVGERHKLGLMLGNLSYHELHVAAGGKSGHGKLTGMGRRHIEGTDPDGAGRAQYGNGSRHRLASHRKQQAVINARGSEQQAVEAV